MRKKPIFALFSMIVIAFLLSACGEEKHSDVVSDDSASSTSVVSQSENSKAPSDSTSSDNQSLDTASKSSKKEIITEENPEFKNILSVKGEINPAYGLFAEKYEGYTVEFDGHIDFIANHGTYSTRWDVLLSSGDWVDENTVSPGPIFKFEDVGLSNMGIRDLYLPDFIRVGGNIHVVATVDSYDENSGLFFLKPISVVER